ncbi:uncharacterized protein LOC107421988 [Ziziphus jujuba]|uniref:Uncharacterized protein LOC107421988 n=1 Tax=Ziziphus jujuba TaxID=326968 RepID=A0A6P4AFI0_ZIZJJ|nr:uncharacterized protein LOC107421988 [Ziziphus jujuba]
MAYEIRKGMQKRPSVLQGDQLFLNRIISRNSTVGCSSRVYYYRSSEGIPFEWEMQPGTPKDPPKEEALPPLSPPPAVISLGLPKPCILNLEPKTPSRSIWLIRFWKKCKKNKHKISSKFENNVGGDLQSDNKYYEKEEFCGSDHEFMASQRHSSTSSSSSPMSFSNGFDMESSSRMRSPARDSFRRPLSCSPWNFSAIMVSNAKRV